jgi:transposase, IS5 family
VGQTGFWDIEERQQNLGKKKDLLLKLNELISWDLFRPILEESRKKDRKNNAGRKAIDVILLFKMLILQQLYNISDEELEYQVNDRISFMQFLGLGLEDKVPDSTSIWLFREALKKQNLIEGLFEEFGEYLNQNGYSAKEGQILDATLIPVPKQHNTKEENAKIREGEEPEGWKDLPHKRSQKDQNARWTKKNDISYFGYKNHINVDAAYKLIRVYKITAASVHDSTVLGELLDGENESDDLWADSAYRSMEIEAILSDMKLESKIHERAYRSRPLTEEQQENNREKSKIRARVEHVFGAIVNEMGGKLVRVIGIERAKVCLGLKNLAYNLKRFVFLESLPA